MVEVARTLGAGRASCFAPSPCRWRARRSRSGCAGAARGAERHRRERISRRPHADPLRLHDLAQPRQPCRRGADRLRHAGDRRGAIALERRGRRDRRYAVSSRRSRIAQPTPLPRGAGFLAALAARSRSSLLRPSAPASFSRRRSGAALVASSTPPSSAHLARTIGLASRRRSVRSSRARGRRPRRASRSAPHRCADIRGRARLRRPGTVLALGLLGPLIAIDDVLTAFGGPRRGAARAVSDGSAAAIVIAYVVRFLPIATGSLSAGLSGSRRASRTRRAASARSPRARAADPAAAPAPGARERRPARLRRLPEGAAGDAPAAPLNAETLATLVYGPPRAAPSRTGARGARHRRRRHLSGDAPRAQRRSTTGLLIAAPWPPKVFSGDVTVARRKHGTTNEAMHARERL